MTLFSIFQKRLRITVACTALLIALPVSHAHATGTASESAPATDNDPGARIYVELLNRQDKAIDTATVAVEAARTQNTHLAFVLSVLVAVMGAVCAWLVMANLAGHWTTPRKGGSGSA